MHAAFFPEAADLTAGLSDESRKRIANWDRLMEVREDVLKSLETARQEKFIGAPLEARVNLSADASLYPLLEQYASELPGLFIVSQVNLANPRRFVKSRDRARGRGQMRALLEIHLGCWILAGVPHGLRCVRVRRHRDA